MKYRFTLAALLLLGFALASRSPAGPLTQEEAERQSQVLERLKKALGEETTDSAKFTHIARAMKGERDVNLRRRILAVATQIPGPDL